jgi:enoyl-CoA hydratase
MIYTARRVKAAEALQLGLVSRVVPLEALLDTCLETACAIAANAPIAVRAAKKAIAEGMQTDIESGLAVELRECVYCFETADQQNAMRAFMEKRKPEPFVNR